MPEPGSSPLTPRKALSFRAVNRRGKPGFDPGLQRHHILPRQILVRTCFQPLLRSLGRDRLNFDDFRHNGLLLPANDHAVVRIGLPLHRGPHRDYNDVLAARVERIRVHFALQAPADLGAARRTATMRLRLLQDVMRRALTDRHGGAFWLNRCDPMRLFADRPYLDDAIGRLFGEA